MIHKIIFTNHGHWTDIANYDIYGCGSALSLYPPLSVTQWGMGWRVRPQGLLKKAAGCFHYLARVVAGPLLLLWRALRMARPHTKTVRAQE